jgi:Tfp pilus assembly protein PilF
MSAGRWSEAAAALDRALALHPRFPPALLYKATICERNGCRAEARELLLRMQRNEPQATLPMWEMIFRRIFGNSPLLAEHLGYLRTLWAATESLA